MVPLSVFTLTPPQIKYLAINLTVYKIYMRKLIKLNGLKELHKWSDILCSWIGKLMLLRCQFWPGAVAHACNPSTLGH